MNDSIRNKILEILRNQSLKPTRLLVETEKSGLDEFDVREEIFRLVYVENKLLFTNNQFLTIP